MADTLMANKKKAEADISAPVEGQIDLDFETAKAMIEAARAQGAVVTEIKSEPQPEVSIQQQMANAWQNLTGLAVGREVHVQTVDEVVVGTVLALALTDSGPVGVSLKVDDGTVWLSWPHIIGVYFADDGELEFVAL